MIKITVNLTPLAASLDRLLDGLHDMSPFMQEVSVIMLGAVDENFEQGGRPTWQAKKDGKPSRLQRSGRLRSSIVRDYDQSSAIVGTNLIYAPIHQLGGTTAAHLIRPRNKKALAFNGVVRRSVKHPGSKIPARPFLVLADDDMDEIELTAEGYLRRLID